MIYYHLKDERPEGLIEILEEDKYYILGDTKKMKIRIFCKHCCWYVRLGIPGSFPSHKTDCIYGKIPVNENFIKKALFLNPSLKMFSKEKI